MNCTACHQPLAPDAKFCGNCGQSVTPAAPVFDRPAGASTANQASSPSPILSSSSHGADKPAAGTGPATVPGSGPIQQTSPAKTGVGLVIGILAALGIGALIWLAAAPTPGAPSAGQDDETSASASDLPQATESDGNTVCFQVALPAGAKATSSRDCQLRVTFSDQEPSSRLSTDTLIGRFDSLQAAVKQRKNVMSQLGDQIVSESAVTVGPYQAHKIVFRYKTENPTDMVHYIVYTGPKYEADGFNVDGLEIEGDYATELERSRVDSFVSGIQWK